jgi:glutathionylspermidine synthase
MTIMEIVRERPASVAEASVLPVDNKLIERQMRHMTGSDRRALAAAQARLSRAVAGSNLHFEGRGYPVSLRPLVITEQQAREFAAIGERFVKLLDRAAAIYCEEKEARDLFPAYRGVARYATALPNLKPLTRICRFDGLIAPDGKYRILETNTDCPGGVIQNGLAGRVWGEVANPLTDDLALDVYAQPFVKNPDCFVLELLAAHRERTGRDAERASIVNFRGRFTNEIDWMQEGLNRLGIPTSLVDAAALLRGRKGLLDPGGHVIELAYNKLDLRDIIDEPEVAEYLEATAAGEVTFLNPLICQWPLADKAVLALMHDERFADCFTATERSLIEAHIPWTRFVRADRTLDPNGTPIDLLSYVIENRESLVLKPTNATRGEGVMVGPLTPQQVWREQVERAAKGSPYVVQEYIRAPCISAPHPSDGAIEPMWVGLDIYVFGGRFAGFQSCASLDAVMNVGKRGILLPVAVNKGSKS